MRGKDLLGQRRARARHADQEDHLTTELRIFSAGDRRGERFGDSIDDARGAGGIPA